MSTARVFGIILVAVAAGSVFFYGVINAYSLLPTSRTPKALTIADLPNGAVPVRHEHGDKENPASQQSIHMDHWVAPSDIGRGGPIFGVLGYRIVSIEYEISADHLADGEVGSAVNGWSLRFPDMRDGLPIAIDHFHVTRALREFDNEPILRVHFMLITHEEEVSYGLTCG